MSDNELAVRGSITGLTVQEAIDQTLLIQSVMKDLMKEDEHYGVIPGCRNKPSLFKAGAEKLCFLFRLAPRFDITMRDLPDGHREYEVITELTHIPTGTVWGQGVGLCTTMESKYRYRNQTAELACPTCGKDLRRSKNKPEWYCWQKLGGCGATYPLDQFEVKAPEKIENPDIADTYNTVLKMAKKRSQVDGILTTTAASDLFTQDIEDLQSASASFPPAKPDPVPIDGEVVEEPEREMHQLTHELQSVMIEIDATRDPPVGIESMSTEDFAKLIIAKKNHGNPLTKLVLDQFLTEERSKAAKIRKIQSNKKQSDPTYLENQAAIIPDASEPRHRPRKRKQDTLRTNPELPDKRLQQLVLPVIGLGLNDLEAHGAVLAWMGNQGCTKLDLADDIQFEKLRNDSAELSVDQWFDLIPKEQRIGA